MKKKFGIILVVSLVLVALSAYFVKKSDAVEFGSKTA